MEFLEATDNSGSYKQYAVLRHCVRWPLGLVLPVLLVKAQLRLDGSTRPFLPLVYAGVTKILEHLFFDSTRGRLEGNVWISAPLRPRQDIETEKS